MHRFKHLGYDIEQNRKVPSCYQVPFQEIVHRQQRNKHTYTQNKFNNVHSYADN